MAQIFYSAIVHSISGKFSGSVLARGKASLRRLTPGPHNPRTEKQQAARGRFSNLCGLWYALTDTQKELWGTYAASLPGKGSGMNVFIALNMRLLSAGHASLVYITSPPPSPSTPPPIEGLTATEGVGETVITWDTPDDPEVVVEIFVWAPTGFFSEADPKWVHIGSVTADTLTWTHTHDYPEDVNLIYTALGLDHYGRSSPDSGQIHTVEAEAYSILIDNSGNADTLSDYQVLLTVSGDAAFYNDADPGGGNVRFWDADKQTELSFWIDSWNYKGTSVFWIKVPSIPASGTKNIYLHIIATGEPTTSSGVNTFVIFDDFQGYNIGDPLNGTRFETYGTNATNFVNIQNDPAGVHGQVVRIVESADYISTGFRCISLNAEGYALHCFFRTNVINANYFNAKEGGNTRVSNTLGHADQPRYQWYNGASYMNFTPASKVLAINTWYETEHQVTKTTSHLILDGEDLTGGLRTAPVDGVTAFYFGPFRKATITQHYSDYRIRKFSRPDPTATLV